MSRYCAEMETESVLLAAEHWKNVALLEDGSVLSSNQLWTLSNLEELDRYFVNSPDTGKGTFDEKLKLQLEPTGPGTRQLAAEMLWFMFLCPCNISASKKCENIEKVWKWSGESFPTDSPYVADNVLKGVGSSGTAYNQFRWRELAFFIRTVTAFKKLSGQEQNTLLTDGWEFARWIEEIPGCSGRQLRNMILFLLFPDEFERIFGGNERGKVLKAFLGIAKKKFNDLSAWEVDRHLLEIRQQKEKEHGTHELDFYNPPLKSFWRDSGQRAWLFLWTPKNWDWSSLDDDRATTHAGRTVNHRWGCANGKVSKGDKAYLVKVGKPPKGIVAIGEIVSEQYEAPHWDKRKEQEGEVHQCVDIAFSRIQDPSRGDPYVTESDLKEIDVDNQRWFPRNAGIEIKPQSARALDKLWKDVVEQRSIPETERVDIRVTEATNKIFYGPPGTGKTYRLNQLIEKYSDKEQAPNKETWLIQEMQNATWFDVIVGALHDLGGRAYVSDIKNHAYVQAKSRFMARTRHVGNTIWAVLQRHAHEYSGTVQYKTRTPPLVFNKSEVGDWTLLSAREPEYKEQIELAQRWKKGPEQQPTSNRCEFVTFHQSYSYEDFVEGIRPVEDGETEGIGYQVMPGILRRICQRAVADPGQRYAIFIDEINRGNIAKIFGELITLIEADKRVVYNDDGSPKSGMEVTLPYSGDQFGVPQNLDFYGTMNTADRSITQLDTALRRRFQFEELMPDADVIPGLRGDGLIEDGEGGAINLRELLEGMNRRIRFLLNRDMTLGHAYFIGVRDFSDLERVFRQQVIPLLQEYFYENWHQIQLVFRDVGPAGGNAEHQIVCHGALKEEEVLGYDHEDYTDSTQYWIADDITPNAIRKVYEKDS